MPAIRPEAISNRIRLTYEVRAASSSLVAERGTIDTLLRRARPRVEAGVSELPPDEEGIPGFGAENDLFAGAAEQSADTPISVAIGRVVLLIQGQARRIAVSRQPPLRPHTS
jgi:hypothetical protein